MDFMLGILLTLYLQDSPIQTLQKGYPVEIFVYKTIKVKSTNIVKPTQVSCMAKAIYFETRGLPWKNKYP